ncbi:MAG: hypothetical protein A3E01_10010 [Gammaproteobacteria bacterium RIFCSPHIGHO2_12_FULL_63_22]|nr:MAG: hypothetical protein A3E01_10010 [Gammaproteobacteria bacterium RIFCSPHIGHO2_12_FULL_63_22]
MPATTRKRVAALMQFGVTPAMAKTGAAILKDAKGRTREQLAEDVFEAMYTAWCFPDRNRAPTIEMTHAVIGFVTCVVLLIVFSGAF